MEVPSNPEFGGVTPLWILTPLSSCLQAPKLLPLPFHLMKRYFSLRQGSWSPSPLTFSWNHLTMRTKRKECIREVGKKLHELCREHNSCMPGIVKHVNSKKGGVSVNFASGRVVIQYTMKCRWVILGSRIKYSGSLCFYHKTTYLPKLVLQREN